MSKPIQESELGLIIEHKSTKMSVHAPVQSTSPVHQSSPLIQSTSLVHRSSPLIQSTSLVHQSSPLIRPTSPVHWSSPLIQSTVTKPSPAFVLQTNTISGTHGTHGHIQHSLSDQCPKAFEHIPGTTNCILTAFYIVKS